MHPVPEIILKTIPFKRKITSCELILMSNFINRKLCPPLIIILIVFFGLDISGNDVASAQNLINPSLVKKLYTLYGNKLFWLSPGEQSHALRLVLKNKVDSSTNMGLNKYKYHYNELARNIDKNFTTEDSVSAKQLDKLFSDVAITYCKDVYQGTGIDKWITYDEVSQKYKDADNDYLLNNLIAVKSTDDLVYFLNSLEPGEKEYILLKSELQNNLKLTSLQRLQLITSINFYRWLHHFNFEKCIVVNIASATLCYYEYDSVKLEMKVVVGKPSTRTPRFTAHCNQVILYPYWNVPTSIALNELLPQFKRNPEDIDILNMQLIDANGNIIDHHKLNWKIYNGNYFPFRIRQSTGCDNSLGVMKFNLTSPLGVYLHDTDNKGAFLSNYPYRSHGCIRVQEPIKLANYLLPNVVDNKFLESCFEDQVPVPINLSKPVPVFVVYQTAEIDSQNVIKYFKDVYGLLK